MTGYWFARYSLAPRPSRGLVPIAWQGYAVIFGFVAGMLVGGLSFLLLGLADRFAIGIAIFALLAVTGAGTFLWAGVARTDPGRTAADYLAERRRT